MNRKIILDTETTGLEVTKGHRLIEIGCLEMVNRRLTGHAFHYYLNPEREVDAGAFQIHGLSNEFLADKPRFSEIAEEFIDFIHQSELIIHNAPFDIGFLTSELKRIQHSTTDLNHICQITDSLQLARQKHPGQPNNLDALCRRYQINHTHRKWHGALLDAELLAHVYLRMTSGQEQLQFFDSDESLNNNANSSLNIHSQSLSRQPRIPLPIIRPTTEETAAHQAFLKQIQERSGHCLWLDLDINSN